MSFFEGGFGPFEIWCPSEQHQNPLLEVASDRVTQHRIARQPCDSRQTCFRLWTPLLTTAVPVASPGGLHLAYAWESQELLSPDPFGVKVYALQHIETPSVNLHKQHLSAKSFVCDFNSLTAVYPGQVYLQSMQSAQGFS